jgi:hypothetical protein
MAVDVATLTIRVDASQVQPAIQALDRLGVQGVRVERATQAATVGTGRLNNAFLMLARQATGTHPAVARLADVMFSMALGGAQMTALLAGLAAISLAYRRLTQDSRDARAEAERLRNELDKLGGFLPAGYGLGQATGQAAADVSRLQGEIASQRRLVEIRGGDSSIFGRSAVTKLAQLEAELSEARGRLIAGQRAIQLDQRGRVVPAGPGARPEDYGPMPPPWLMDTGGVGRFTNGQNPLFFAGGPTPGVDMAQVDRFADRLAERQQQLQRSAPSGGSIANQAIGLGSAAFAGIGLGLSSGSAALGGIGGGVTGFGMAGPAGAILGAVGGIVSGLFEAGKRAQEAARQWARAFEDFENMFVERTPLEQDLERNQRAYEDLGKAAIENALSGGITADEFRELQQRLAELDAQREKNIDAATKLAKAEKDLYDARFTALNAPSGFNASYYGWMAGFPDDKRSASEIMVNVFVDGREVATSVETQNFVKNRRGGTSSIVIPTR